MDHVAIDIGGRESQVCRRRENGEIVEEKRVLTRALEAYFKTLAPGSRVILETCSEAFGIADVAQALQHDVRVVSAQLAPSLGVGARRLKTDRRDARALSEASCRMDLPSVHIPTAESRRRKTEAGMRDALIAARTKIINTVRGWLRAEAFRLTRGGVETLCSRIRQHAERHAYELPSYVRRQLEIIEQLTKQIAEADRELAATAKADPRCRRLMTVPGVGPVNAILFTAVLDQVDRFPNSAAVTSYLGLTPGEKSSSSTLRRTSITKAGSSRMRRLLVQAAWAARNCKTAHPMVSWSLQVEKRRGRRVAVIALARKLAAILYAIWRDGTCYIPSMGAAPLEEPMDHSVE
jgi:transposase